MSEMSELDIQRKRVEDIILSLPKDRERGYVEAFVDTMELIADLMTGGYQYEIVGLPEEGRAGLVGWLQGYDEEVKFHNVYKYPDYKKEEK